MKLTKEEFKRIETAEPLDLFHQGIKAEETRDKYTRTLRQVLCKLLEEILDGTFEERVAQLVKYGKENPDWVRDLLINISRKLRERTMLPHEHPDYYNPVSFDNYFKPIKKLLDMNDVVISWKRIYATFPEIDNVSDSRGWHREEIQLMLKYAKGAIDRALILVASLSGIRIGGFDLNWGSLEPIYKDGEELSFAKTDKLVVCAKIAIYHGTSASYPAFITPEAYEAIQDYRKVWIEQVGREPKSGDPLFKKDGPYLMRATHISITKRIERIIRQAGLRNANRKINKRYDVPMMNGFRRFWNKTCKESLSKESPLSSLIKKEYMMGHSGLVSLDKNYFKTHIMELADEYLGAVPNLTIDSSVRLLESNRRKSKKILELESDKDRQIKELYSMVSVLTERINFK